MSELTAAIDANDEVLNIDTLPPSPYVQIDDEVMEIRGVKPEQVYPPTQEIRPPTIRVKRGAGGTTAASHADGATLEPVYGLGGGVGGEQTIRLLGPFSFAFNTPGITTGQGVKAFDLEVGQVVIRAWFVNTAFWDGTDVAVGLSIGPGTGNDNQQLQVPTDPTLGGPTLAAGVYIEDMFGTTGADETHTRASIVFDEGIGVYVKYVGTDVTQGTADMYALIAEPAA